ncbi:MAG: DUF2190 family protein [Gemmatimonadales bacterium]|nr:DUF2190 family protein [Gemmatimonadales bacterium]
MPVQIPGNMHSICTAGADFSADAQQYRGRVQSTANDFEMVAPTLNEGISGVQQNKPASGQAITIMTTGITQAVSAAAITRGDYCSVDADGRFKTAAAGQQRVGRAMESAGGADITFTLNLDDKGGDDA